MIVELANGRTFHVQRIDDSYHVVIDGAAYCAPSADLLLEGLSKVFHLAHRITVIPRDPVREAILVLQSHNSTLRDRQSAMADLRNLAQGGIVEAAAIVRLLDSRQQPSPHAVAVTMMLGKTDFGEVTHEELVKHVKDLVLRAKLLLELSDRVRLS